MKKEQASQQSKNQSLYQIGDEYEIPPEGSLGLLALGVQGLKLWRDKRAQANKKQHFRK